MQIQPWGCSPVCSPGASQHTHASEVSYSENKSEANYQSQRTKAFVTLQKDKKLERPIQKKNGTTPTCVL